MFQPTMDFNNVGVTAIDNDHIFLYMTNGAGENRYTTIWTIKQGKVQSQIIYKTLNNSVIFITFAAESPAFGFQEIGFA